MASILNNPRILVLVIALVLVSGLSALHILPRAEDPTIGNRVALALVAFPGASAERVEALVTEPLEQKLRELPEILNLSSSSGAGLAVLTIELDDTVGYFETEAMWAQVRDKLAEAAPLLPNGASEPRLDDQLGNAFTVLLSLSWQGTGEPDLLLLGRYADELKSRLRNLHGTDYIRLQGQPQEQITVAVAPESLALVGLDIRQLSQALAEADAKVSAGELNNRQQRLSLEVAGALDSVERIRQVPLVVDQAGAAVRVGDVATVSRAPRQPHIEQAIIDGEPAVVVAVRMLPNQRGDLWAADLRAAVEDFSHILPANVQVKWLFNQERYTTERLRTLVANVVTGFVLIALVLLVSLGWRAALIVSAALPLIVLFALSCMHYFKVPIHQMSVTGLIVALGIMVDNAIVMTDTVARYKREGLDGRKAAYAAVQHLWVPLLGSTLTTVLAFMPIVLMAGASGEFVGSISLTVIFSLVGSYLISHLVVVALAGRFVRREEGGHWYQGGLAMPHTARLFSQSLHWALVHPVKVVAGVVSLPVLGFWLAGFLPAQFFPPSDRDMINFEVFLPASASVQATRDLTERISAELADIEGIESLHWFLGRNAPSFYYNLMQRKNGAPYYAQGMLTAKDFRIANRLVPLLQRRLDERFPEAQIIVRRLEQGPPFNAPVELRLVGSDLTLLRELGDELRRRLLMTEHVVHVRSTLLPTVPKAWLLLDEHEARLAGASLGGAAAQLQASLDGVQGGSVLEDIESLPVQVEMAGYRASTLDAMGSWLLVPPQGGSSSGVPLSVLGQVDVRPAEAVIPRRNGQRVNTIEVFLRDGVLPDQVLQAARAQLAESPLALPAGYHLEIGGEDEKRARAISKLLAPMGLIVVLLVVAVVMSFNSFRLSAVIFAVAVLAAGLGLLSLSLYRSPFGFTSIIGLMALIGLAINAAIVIIAELKSNPEAVGGNAAPVVESVTACGRHIGSTTVTTVMGFMPLLLEGGAFWPPFAVVIAGGTVLATLLSFYFVPVCWVLMARHNPFVAAEPIRVSSKV